MQAPQRIAIVGLGYVGLPTALALLNKGVRVIGYDVSQARIDAIRTGNVDLIPADLERLRVFGNSPLFTMTTDPEMLRQADVMLICVPTPVDNNHQPDLRILRSACETVVAQAQSGQTLALTSTTYPGCTNELLVQPLTKRGFRVGIDIFVAFSPERIDPGNVTNVQETVPRVVGGFTPACTQRAAQAIGLVAPMVHQVDDLQVAELAKLLENTFRAVNIALVNEFANLANRLGVRIEDVIKAAATKPYGFMPFWPGPGVGGHCIPVDPHYLGDLSQMPVVQAAMAAIHSRHTVITRCISDTLVKAGKPLQGASVCLVGAAFKPDVADVRDTPATPIINDLLRAGAKVWYYDPLVESLAVGGQQIPQGEPDASAYDIVVVLVAHKDVDHSWLESHDLVVDATYRMPNIKNRVTP